MLSLFRLFSVSTVSLFFFFNDPATTEIYTLSLHDALPICFVGVSNFTGAMITECMRTRRIDVSQVGYHRSEEHTSELQSLTNLVCRLLLEKKKQNTTKSTRISPVEDHTRHYRDGHSSTNTS